MSPAIVAGLASPVVAPSFREQSGRFDLGLPEWIAGAIDTPEAGLLVALIEDAMYDAVNYKNSPRASLRERARDATRWLHGETIAGPPWFDIATACAYLNIDPSVIVRAYRLQSSGFARQRRVVRTHRKPLDQLR